jgi:hypothetical protein
MATSNVVRIPNKTFEFPTKWCRGRESNPHDSFESQDFKSCASASFATPAREDSLDFTCFSEWRGVGLLPSVHAICPRPLTLAPVQHGTDPIRQAAYSSGGTTMSEFNRTCPACTSGRGIPRSVTAARGTYMVTLACDKCGHNWATERKPDFELFQPRQRTASHSVNSPLLLCHGGSPTTRAFVQTLDAFTNQLRS